MATTNFSENEFEKQTIVLFQRSFCLPDSSTRMYGQLALISVFNSFLSITAFFGNALVLAALRKESSLHPSFKVLLRNLATTDICVGLISQPLYAALLLTVVNEHWNVCRYVAVIVCITSFILCTVSLLTLTAISVDRLLALLLTLGLRYRQVVTLRRAYGTVIAIWAFSTVYATFELFLDFRRYRIMVRSFINITVSSNLRSSVIRGFSSTFTIVKINFKTKYSNRTKQIN